MAIRKGSVMLYIITFIVGLMLGLVLTCIVVSGKGK